MLNHPLAQYFWLAYALVIGSMLISSSALFFKQKTPASSLMLAGSIAGTLGGFTAQTMIALSIEFGWDIFTPSGTPPSNAFQFLQVCYGLSVLGHIAFHAGLLIYAMRLKQQSTRLAELEAIFEDRGGNLQ